MRYFIIAGEQSGDLHGSNLIKGLKKHDHESHIYCWGGEMMKDAGGELLMHYRSLAIMGFVNVLLHLRTIARNLKICKQQIGEIKPDLVILIDFPGFNLRIAEFAKETGVKVFYYISPKLWAWKESRVAKIKKFVDRMFIIFPFEVEFYRKHGITVEYYGNPLVDEIESAKTVLGDRQVLRKKLGFDDRPVITIMAGSRKHEIEHILPSMVAAAGQFPDYQFVLNCVQSIPEKVYMKIIGNRPVILSYGKTYEMLWISEAALVKSGTSTLEAALLGVPQVVCYKGDTLSFEIARRLVKIKYISLVNLILDKPAVKELIQYDLNENTIASELRRIIPGGDRNEEIMKSYSELKGILGGEGASDRVAAEMVKRLKEG